MTQSSLSRPPLPALLVLGCWTGPRGEQSRLGCSEDAVQHTAEFYGIFFVFVRYKACFNTTGETSSCSIVITAYQQIRISLS